jgi:uncharacterized membrane protein
MGLFSLAALTGLILVIVGMGRAPFVEVWTPPSWGRQVAIFAMTVALTLFIGAFAVFDIWSANRRGAERSAKVAPR